MYYAWGLDLTTSAATLYATNRMCNFVSRDFKNYIDLRQVQGNKISVEIVTSLCANSRSVYKNLQKNCLSELTHGLAGLHTLF